MAKVGRLAILRDLYGEVYVPPAVAAELRAKRDVASQEVEGFWCRHAREIWAPGRRRPSPSQ